MGGRPVVIVGGGASGTLVALALARAPGQEWPVVLVGDTAEPGAGLAYGPVEPYHLLNSRAGTMSALPDHPDDLLAWCATTGRPVDAGAFLPRRRYRGYLADRLASAAVDYRRGRVVAVRPDGDGAVVELAGGGRLAASRVVLAAGHGPSRWAPDADPARVVADPWRPGALARTGYRGPVLLVGSGLTAVDVALAVHRHNPAAMIHAVSRHGLLPTAHTEAGPPPASPDLGTPASTRELLHAVRGALADAAADGLDWRAVVDGLRGSADRLWRGLPVDERLRFVRHVDRYWQVCRHRMAPVVARTVRALLDAGTLRITAGRVTGLASEGGGVRLELRTPTGERRVLRGATAVNCTGPGSLAAADDPLPVSLRTAGLARLNPLATGFDVDGAGALLDAAGRPSPVLSAVGPLRRGASWETTAVPEIRSQAAALAAAPSAPGGRARIPQPA